MKLRCQKKKMSKHIIKVIEIYADESDKEDCDEETSDEESSNEKNSDEKNWNLLLNWITTDGNEWW